MKEERNIAMAVILTFVTCGIYGLYWFVKMTDEVKEASNNTQMQSGVLALVLTLVTCGLYGLYWAYQMGKLLETAQKNHGLTAKDNSVLYLILEFFGLGIVDYCLIQNDLNEIVRAGGNGVTEAPNTTV